MWKISSEVAADIFIFLKGQMRHVRHHVKEALKLLIHSSRQLDKTGRKNNVIVKFDLLFFVLKKQITYIIFVVAAILKM